MTSEGLEVSWEDIGIAFSIPQGAVPDNEELKLSVRPCLAGPFGLPLGYKLTSPVYIISPHFHFKKDIQLVIYHFANLKTDEDTENMSFLSAPSSPQSTGSRLRYEFKSLKGGVFQKNESFGTISLRHFCAASTGSSSRKRPFDYASVSDTEDTPEPKRLQVNNLESSTKGKATSKLNEVLPLLASLPVSCRTFFPSSGVSLLYSVRLYRDSPPVGPCTRAVFCIILNQALYRNVRNVHY